MIMTTKIWTIALVQVSLVRATMTVITVLTTNEIWNIMEWYYQWSSYAAVKPYHNPTKTSHNILITISLVIMITIMMLSTRMIITVLHKIIALCRLGWIILTQTVIIITRILAAKHWQSCCNSNDAIMMMIIVIVMTIVTTFKCQYYGSTHVDTHDSKCNSSDIRTMVYINTRTSMDYNTNSNTNASY